jgi:hypothetical protein
MRAARVLIASLVAIAPLAVAASCSKERLEPTNPGWFEPCVSDVDCAVGACLCGRCSVECDEGSDACSGGPPASACFARGSIAHEELCGSSDEPEALCLPTCANDDDCTDGLTCAVGACLPVPVPRTADAGSDSCTEASCPSVMTPEGRRVFNERALLPPEFHWAPEVIDEETLYTDQGPARDVGYDRVCLPENPCPTLEQVLSEDACIEVIQSCDLIRVAERYGRFMYWYTGYGTAPVAAVRRPQSGDNGGYGRYGTTRELGCATTEITMCSTCGYEHPRCEDLPGVLPAPPPPMPVSGCACESDDQGGARVSLDCFCSLYDCNSRDELRAECAYENEVLGGDDPLTIEAADACGQVWFRTREFAGRQLAYDASGALVGALAYSPGPVTAPCNSVRVSAGVIADCPAAATCICNLSSVAPTAPANTGCETMDWFQAL